MQLTLGKPMSTWTKTRWFHYLLEFSLWLSMENPNAVTDKKHSTSIINLEIFQGELQFLHVSPPYADYFISITFFFFNGESAPTLKFNVWQAISYCIFPSQLFGCQWIYFRLFMCILHKSSIKLSSVKVRGFSDLQLSCISHISRRPNGALNSYLHIRLTNIWRRK